MAIRDFTRFAVLFLLAVSLAGCGGSPQAPATITAGQVMDQVISAAALDSNPNPAGCASAPSVDSFGGCALQSFAVHIGRTVELQDSFPAPHHLFVTQETAPGFDGVTGIVLHYQKINPATGKMEPGDDGLGYWCPNDATAELYFGLTYKPADHAKGLTGGWYATHQRIKCRDIEGTGDVFGKGYLIFADLPGDTGPVTYSTCWQANVLTWDVSNCAAPGSTGWRTIMGRKNGVPITVQMEGAAVLGTGRLDAAEAWQADGDLLSVFVIDDGHGVGKTDLRLSLRRVAIVN